MEPVLLVAAWLFAATHIDTLIVLTAFCADDDYQTSEVLLGHYAGFSAGLAAAVLAALVAAEFLHAWTFLLGVIPLGLGIWGLVRQPRMVDTDDVQIVPSPAGRVGVVTAAGIGLSGENIAVFLPFFVRLSATELSVVVALYLAGAGAVFLVAVLLARRTAALGIPVWIDRWLVPIVLSLVGVYVLAVGWFAV